MIILLLKLMVSRVKIEKYPSKTLSKTYKSNLKKPSTKLLKDLKIEQNVKKKERITRRSSAQFTQIHKRSM